jgi:hypothetical protein
VSIICQNLLIWKLLLSKQLEFWKAQSLKNRHGSPRRKKNEWTCWTRSTGLLNHGVAT